MGEEPFGPLGASPWGGSVIEKDYWVSGLEIYVPRMPCATVQETRINATNG